MYEKMRQAKSSIYIANYDLDPDLQLIRGGGDKQSFQISDLVSSPCISESSITYGESNNGSFNSSLHNNNDHDNKKYHTLQNLLIEKAKQKVDIKIIVWEPRSIIRKLPGIKKRGLEGREKKVEAIKKAAK